MRFLGTLAVLVVTGTVWANVPPPPPQPPKGKKYLPVEYRVKVEEVPKGYVLCINTTEMFSEPPTPWKMNTERTLKIHGWTDIVGWRHVSPLFAVPEDMIPTLKTLNDWRVELGKEESKILWYKLEAEELVDETDERKSVPRAFTLKTIDPKEGIKLEEVTEEQKPEQKDEKQPLTLSELGTLIGCIASALAVTLGGLWLIRRKR